MVENTSATGSGRDAQITIYPDGPMLVRGDVEILAADGSPLPRRRRTVALCRCGHSGLTPLCDGTHKLVWKPGRDSAVSRRVAAAEED
jgi:CDGSH-type Zn-finger protein